MSRSLWSDRPLGVKLAALVAAGAVALGVFAVVTVQALDGTGERTDDVLASAEATGDALEADMMHDAVRGDVLQALLSVGGTRSTDRRHRPEGAQRPVPRRPRRDGRRRPQPRGRWPPSTGHTRRRGLPGRRRADHRRWPGTDPVAARAAYPAFAAAFKALEERAAGRGRRRGRLRGGRRAGRPRTSGAPRSRWRWSSRPVGVLVLGLLGWVVTRSVVGPLRRVGAVVPGLADGDLRGTTGVSSRDEVGQMAAALEASMANMRTVLDRDRRQLHHPGLGHRGALGQRAGHGAAGRRVLGAERHRRQRRRPGVDQRADRLGRLGADGRLDPRDRPERHRGGPRRRPGGRPPPTPPPPRSPSWASPRWRSPASSR